MEAVRELSMLLFLRVLVSVIVLSSAVVARLFFY